MKKIKKMVLLVLIAMLLILGCAVKKPEKDEFWEKWSKLAETSHGYTPTPQKKVLDVADNASTTVTLQQHIILDNETLVARPLPTIPINLKMRNADIKSLLRSMARAADINILIKEDIAANITVDFVKTPWEQAFKTILKSYGLTYVWEGEILRVLTLKDIEDEFKFEELQDKRKAQKQVSRLVEPLQTALVKVNYADAKALRETLLDFLTKEKDGKARGSIRNDEHNNTLIVQAIKDDLVKITTMISKLDVPAKQILIKANIVETTREVARHLGIQWGGIGKFARGDSGKSIWLTPGGSLTASTTGANAATNIPTTPGDPLISAQYSPINPGGLSGHGSAIDFGVKGALQGAQAGASLGLLTGRIGANMLELQLQALQKEGKINILSSPSITTMDNHKASTESGEKVPYVTTSTSGGATTSTVSFVDAVLRLEITPQIIDDKNIKLKIVIKKDEVDMSRAVQGNPLIVKKQTETLLISEDGETIVISGLTRQRNTKAEAGMPGAKDIPVLGWLFKNDSLTETAEEVLIFITPQILPQR